MRSSVRATASNDDDEEAVDEKKQWSFKEILSPDSIAESNKRYNDGCGLLGCCLCTSTSGENHHSCIDCQDKDFGGWPSLEKLPATHLEKGHMKLLVEKHLKKKAPKMPALSASPVVETVCEDSDQEEDECECLGLDYASSEALVADMAEKDAITLSLAARAALAMVQSPSNASTKVVATNK